MASKVPDRSRQPADAAKDAQAELDTLNTSLQFALVRRSTLRFEHLSLCICKRAVGAPHFYALAPSCLTCWNSMMFVSLLEANSK